MNLRQLFIQHVAQTNNKPLAFQPEKAKGIYIYDQEGTRYIDVISGVSVCNVGHCHPQVVKAIQKQAETYMHVMVYGEYVEAPQVLYAQALANHLAPSLNTVYFVSSGTEATEGALKLAKRATGRFEIVSFGQSYHGSTMGALSVMGSETFRQNYRPLIPGNRMLSYGSSQEVDKITEETAAVIVEPIQAESGITVPPQGWLLALRQRCDKVGALLIFDEIQTGFGRTGSLFAHQEAGVVPDILLLAKAMGGGMPLGAFIADSALMKVLQDNPMLGHITTFGGHPVSCAAGLAAFNVLHDESLVATVQEKANLFLSKLGHHPAISHIGQAGLMLALHFESFEQNERIVRKCFDLGLITDWFLFAPNALRIAPPLNITKQEIAKACDIILKALDSEG